MRSIEKMFPLGALKRDIYLVNKLPNGESHFHHCEARSKDISMCSFLHPRTRGEERKRGGSSVDPQATIRVRLTRKDPIPLPARVALRNAAEGSDIKMVRSRVRPLLLISDSKLSRNELDQRPIRKFSRGLVARGYSRAATAKC